MDLKKKKRLTPKDPWLGDHRTFLGRNKSSYGTWVLLARNGNSDYKRWVKGLF